MKNRQEIQKLAEKSAEDVKENHTDYRFKDVYKEFYIEGYEQCQENMAENIIKIQTENEKLKKDIDKLVTEISLANRFIKSQKEYYEKITNKNN